MFGCLCCLFVRLCVIGFPHAVVLYVFFVCVCLFSVFVWCVCFLVVLLFVVLLLVCLCVVGRCRVFVLFV